MKTLRYTFLFLLTLHFTGIVKAQNTTPVALRARTMDLLMRNRLDSARLISQQLIQQSPTADHLLLAGAVAEASGDRQRSDALYQQALRTAPDTAKYKVNATLGYMSLRRGDTVKAISYQLQSLRLRPQQGVPHYILSLLYQMKQRPDSAAFHARAAYQNDSSKIEYIRLMTNLSYADGNLPLAIRYLRRLYDVRKSVADVDSNKTKEALATYYLKLDRYALASPFLKELLKDSTRKDVYYYNLALCDHYLGSQDEALKHISSAIWLSGSSQQGYYDLKIKIYEQLGQTQQLLATYMEGSKKGFPSYVKWLASYRQVVTLANDILRRLSREAHNQQLADLYQLAKIYAFTQEDAHALKVLQDYDQLKGPRTDSLMVLYATAYAGLNRLADARQAITVAVNSGNDNLEYETLLLAILYRQSDYKAIIERLTNRKQSLVQDTGFTNELLFKSYTLLGDINQAKKFLPPNPAY